MVKTEIDILTKDFAVFEDLLGAYRALSHLTNTYRLDWVKLTSLPQSVVTLEDVDNLAIVAFETKLYDTCVDLLKAAYRLVPYRREEYKTMKAKMDLQKKGLIKIHNQLVIKRKARVGENHKGNCFYLSFEFSSNSVSQIKSIDSKGLL